MEDQRLSAIVRHRVRLLYEQGADAATDRPAHVRAASSIARVGREIAVVQDDANFIALIDPATGLGRAIPLPPGEGDVRQFDRDRGNKHHKLDLEACVVCEVGGDATLLALGSGSTARREVVAMIRFRPGDPEVRVVRLPEFYAALRAETAFAGSELNIEGAIVVGGRLRLFGRGNGRSIGGLSAVSATCDVDLSAFIVHVEHPSAVTAPSPTNAVAYDLGSIAGVRLGFTDAAGHGAITFYSAAAEGSPDSVEDGPVRGSAIGIINERGVVRWSAVTEPSGEMFAGKVEGILIDPSRPSRLLAVVDVDDPQVPSELCTIELAGPWLPRAGPREDTHPPFVEF